MRRIDFTDVSITGGIFKDKQRLIGEKTIYAVQKRFAQTGRFKAFEMNWREGMENRPHIFWDSDVAKWIESVAYLLELGFAKDLEPEVDRLIKLIEEHQGEDGYFNIYFTVVEPNARWTRRTDHELYCAGHLIEAAVAYCRATGKDRFLNAMRRYADYIERVFVRERSAAFTTPGHEGIELALVRLHRATGEERYLDLARFFVNERGRREEAHYPNVKSSYAQAHLPVREQRIAEGHSVRAMYLYCAMADLARIDDDAGLKEACEALFDNVTQRRMYITGGIGSSARGEAFTLDYDLPNLTAYSETCAAIGLALFANRMLSLSADGRYADIVERALYNGVLSGISLDGISFFYENPLQIRPEIFNRDASVNDGGRLPIARRQEVFGCSCCPPNITRFIPSLGDFLYALDGDALYIHQYMQSRASFHGVQVEVLTDYPNDGRIFVKAKNIRRVALRIPGWCEGFCVRVDGRPVAAEPEKGYITLENAGEIELNLAMDPLYAESGAQVAENAGRVALTRGPVVYCLEEVDNGKNLSDIRVPVDRAEFDARPDAIFGLPVIRTTGYRKKEGGPLYRRASDDLVEVPLTFIPYSGFANRSLSEMIVWVLKK